MKVRPVAATLAIVFLLAGCSRPSTMTPVPEDPIVEVPAVECLTVAPLALQGLQDGLDQKQSGFTMERAAAYKSMQSDGWFVAGVFTGPGVPSQVGIWYTMYDPQLDAETAYVSVDAFASEFSWYLQPEGFSSALDGVDEVKSCVN